MDVYTVCALWEKIVRQRTVQIVLGFASYNFPIAMQFLPKLHSHPCGYLLTLSTHAPEGYSSTVLQLSICQSVNIGSQ